MTTTIDMKQKRIASNINYHQPNVSLKCNLGFTNNIWWFLFQRLASHCHTSTQQGVPLAPHSFILVTMLCFCTSYVFTNSFTFWSYALLFPVHYPHKVQSCSNSTRLLFYLFFLI